MNKDQVAGKIAQAVGKVEQSVGERVGNQKLANKGVVNQAKVRRRKPGAMPRTPRSRSMNRIRRPLPRRAPRAGRSSASLWMTPKRRPRAGLMNSNGATLHDTEAPQFELLH